MSTRLRLRLSAAPPVGPSRPSRRGAAGTALALYLCLALVTVAARCSDAATATEPPAEAVSIASVTVTGPTEPLTVGQTAQLTATVRDQSGNVLTGRSVAWRSSSESVATVSSAGRATAVGPGSATITATVENRSGDLALTVHAPESIPDDQIAAIEVTPADPSVNVGATLQLSATARNADGAPLTGVTFVWTSDQPGIASVDAASGVARGVTPGSATLSASAGGRTGSTTLRVNPLPPPTSTGTIAYVRRNELRLIEPDGSGDRLIWSTPDPRYTVSVPAWRPDGSEIAFVSDHEMALSIFQQDLYAVRPDGSGLRRLTNGPAHDRLASYPKGTVSVTVSNLSFNGGPFFVYVLGAAEPQQITLGVGSSARLTFTNVADLGEGVLQPVVVIDGIQRWRDAAVAADVKPDQTTSAGTLGITANPLERLGAYGPAWRADGARVGYILSASARGNAACLLQQLAADPPPASTGQPLLDADAFGPICAWDWGPTPALADQLLVLDNTSDYTSSGRTHVYRVTEGSRSLGAPVATFDRYVRVVDLRWLPDGSGFLVARQDDLVDEDINLYEFSFATGSLRKLTDFTGEFVRAFSLSPDGQSIVFERVGGGSVYDLATLPSDLWVVNRDGSGLRLLVRDATGPAWNPQRR